MSASLKLRDYQREAINCLFSAWQGGMSARRSCCRPAPGRR